MLIHRFLAATLLAGLLATPAPAAEPAKPSTASAPPARSSTHHRGMRGEKSPYRGWANYGHLTLDIGTDRYFVYDQSATEFSATVIERGTETIKIRGISIPGAGLFYYPAEASPCAPDALERMGLYAEQLLFYFSQAFPSGPASIKAASEGVVDRDVPELHFMGGTMKAHGGSRTRVTAARLPSGQIEYLLQDDKDKVKGVWEPRGGAGVVPDGEPLLAWKVCWAGAWKTRADGGSRFAPSLANASELKTFGDVRKALRASRKPAAKQQ